MESNKKNLIKVLNSYILYDEFLAYCEKKCCGEYAVRNRIFKIINILKNINKKKKKWSNFYI